jgi:hypothetical protein
MTPKVHNLHSIKTAAVRYQLTTPTHLQSCQQQLQNCSWHQHQNHCLVCALIWGMCVCSGLLVWHATVCCASLLVAACYMIMCALFCPDEHAEAGASQREQRQEQGRQQREADALKQQEKLQKRKEKKERRQSLAANTAAPRLSHVAQTDAGALPLFPEQKTDPKVGCCLPWLTCILAAQAAPLITAAAQSIC